MALLAMPSRYAARRRRNFVAMGLSMTATAFGLGWLVLILGVLLWEGFSGLSLRVFTEMTPPPGSAGGLLNPIFGSLVLTILAVIIGTPIGILAVIYVVMVYPMGHFSGLAGSVALAVIVMPVVVRTTEDMLNLVPNQLREAAAALGMPRAYIIARVCYKA